MEKLLMMTPGPTELSDEVREAMARPITNPDLDLTFFETYKDLTEKFQRLLKTENEVVILSGEGILGLEAACATLTEKGDKVLVLDNGFFGRGFGEFAAMYGADITNLEFDYRRGIDVAKLEAFLSQNNDFKYATLVHCETPSGITNPIHLICPILKKYGIITVVDAVASAGGEKLEVDEWGIDLLIVGSQKCLSASPGLTIVSMSKDFLDAVEKRKQPIQSFYCNLMTFRGYYEKKEFPYTQPISNIYSLSVAVDELLEGDAVKKHKQTAEAFREAIVEGGLELYPEDSYSNTATAIMLPEGISFKDVFEQMKNSHHILVAGTYGSMQGKMFRIGHMGYICDAQKLKATLEALQQTMEKLGYSLETNMSEVFIERLKAY